MKKIYAFLSQRVPWPPFIIVAFIFILSFWLALTPDGLLGKADAIGYAVCHRISVRSFFLGDRQLPLCARCTGMHLGAFFTLIYQIGRGKRGSLPDKKFLAIFALFLLAFAFDGANSYLNLLDRFPYLYVTQNWMRLLTGTLLGTGIGVVLYPVFNQSIWFDWIPEAAINSWKQLLIILGIAFLIILAVLSENPFLSYPLAIISAANVLLVLSTIYTILWVMLARRDNQFYDFRQLRWFMLAGLTTALLQIALMDYARYLLTGTWQGFASLMLHLI
ncbi:MAG: DUF2085 domain-containing protein [Anaerolineae bacterium]|nr:DUF2085 domain-containing protein [Anaerolineae bacterium]